MDISIPKEKADQMVAQLLKANPGIDVSIDYLAVGRSSENDYIYADKARLAGPIAVFAVEVILLTLQVCSEEKRLESDFGQEYLDYKERVPRYLSRWPHEK